MINTPDTKVCFLGGGNMARAMIAGMLSAGFAAQQIWATARSTATTEQLHNLGNINVSIDNIEAVKHADIIFLAVKPKDLHTITDQIKNTLNPEQIIVSIAAGASIDTIKNSLDTHLNIVRAMPNTPVQVRQGVYGLYTKDNLPAASKQLVTDLLKLTGQTIWLSSEAALDQLTSISGCGPAYVFMLIASLEQAALNLGLPVDHARTIAVQTVIGAGSLVLHSTESAQRLCQNVCSPGGMTEQGVKHLQEKDFDSMIQTAVQKTYEHLQKSLKT